MDSEYLRQAEVCATLGLPIADKVYQSWKPINRTLRSLAFSVNFIKKHEKVSVRQVYYALVSHMGLPNTRNDYKKTVNLLKRARLAGIIPFNAIIDDTREAEKTPSWDSIRQILGAAIHQYRSDWWEDQFYYVEVWLEKRALKRIFYPITNAYDVHLCIGGGYQSWSEIWEAKKRFDQRPQPVAILYFGDLDPSGKDIPRDLENRFEILGVPVKVEQIALTKQDVEEYNLPRNPFIKEDPRQAWYIEKYGITYGVELDALPPDVLKQKIVKAITTYAQVDALKAHKFKDQQDRELWDRIINDGYEEE